MQRPNMKSAVILALLALVLGIFFWNNRVPADIPVSPRVEVGDQSIRVLIADSPEERSQGLGGRSSLAPDEGMLFVFDAEDRHGFWMKDMLISIDIIWIRSGGEVVDIAANVSPDTYPASFFPSGPARYVLEVAGGFVERHKVSPGDVIQLGNAL